jgi:hypothetical protein
MFEKFINAIGARKKQIIWVLVIIGIFYLFSVWNVGSILSFLAFYDYGFAFLTINAGLNEWLARGILIPAAALMAWSTMSMLSLTNKLRRQIGAVTLIVLLSSLSFAMYFYTKAAYSGASNFSKFSGESFKRFCKQDEYVELFPKTIKFHPITGAKLEILTPEKLEELEKNNETLIFRFGDSRDDYVKEIEARKSIKKKREEDSLAKQLQSDKERRIAEQKKEEENLEKELMATKDKNGNTVLFDSVTGEPNFNYFIENGGLTLFRNTTKRHPALGKELHPFSKDALESYKKQPKLSVEREFGSHMNNGDTGYYVLNGDSLIFLSRYNEQIPVRVKIGEKGKEYFFWLSSGNPFKFSADSDGKLFVESYRKKDDSFFSPYIYYSVLVTGLSMRLSN